MKGPVDDPPRPWPPALEVFVHALDDAIAVQLVQPANMCLLARITLFWYWLTRGT